MTLSLKAVVLNKLAKEHCEQQNKQDKKILTWKEFTRDRASGMSFMRVERAVELALAAKQAEVLKIVREVEEGFEGTTVEFCEKHGDASYTGFKECLKEILRRLLVKVEQKRRKNNV